MKNARFVILFVVGVAMLLIASSCGQPTPDVIEKPVTVVVPVKETVVVKETVAPPPGPGEPGEGAVEVPFEALWASSGHADAEAEAFVHWDEDDPAVVPTSCAKCHSTPGFLDFLGVDGTAFGAVDNDAPVGTVISCVACHNEATVALDSVVFPSGVEVTGLGPEARCMQCHQGRASKGSVDATIESAGMTEDLDTVSEDIGFTNIHYFAAAATLSGGTAMGGYQYEGKTYDAKLTHVEGYNSCVGCHNPHTLELKVQECAACHTGVASAEDLRDVRFPGSLVDYDGDGNTEEGIYYEIEGLRDLLYQAMQAYGNEVAGAAPVYDVHSYPYFFTDSNGNGLADEEEAVRDNAFAGWTGRLSKAAYNYQVSLKDPGAYAHGGKYIIQLLYDSIEDLNGAISAPIDLASAHRIDHGHFAGSEEAFRHWDEDGEVSGSCSKCHSATGLPFYLKEGVTASQPLANGLACATCHDDVSTFTRYEVTEVKFPSGASLDTGNPDSNLCINCHQGRESMVSVNARIGTVEDDTVSDRLGFQNIHYFPAGVTLFGADAQGGYQFEGKSYVGRNAHVPGFDSCTQCHNTHALEVKVEACGTCHAGTATEEDLKSIRIGKVDYDGDGDTTEGIAGEVETMYDALYAAMQAYATDEVGNGIVYDAHSYPYFFIDTNGNGVADADEATRTNAFASFTPRLVRATYNYQLATKDPGAFAHNGKYIIQLLYDTLEHLGASVSGMTRP